jgi:hypothetical protein
MTRPSKEILRLAHELVRLSRTSWTEAEAELFLDQLNPSIRRSLLLQQLTSPRGRLTTDPLSIRNKISAIKSIRSATGWALKESKEFVELAAGEIDQCSILGQTITEPVLPTDLDSEQLSQLERDLAGSGYRLE